MVCNAYINFGFYLKKTVGIIPIPIYCLSINYIIYYFIILQYINLCVNT